MLFWKLMSASVRSQMQYPASFVMLTLSQFVATSVHLLGIWVLFDRFHMIQGWAFWEVGLLYGITQTGFALAEMMAQGFENFSQLIKTGDFDRLLLRPLSPLFQLAAREMQLMRIGRVLQAVGVLIWSTFQVKVSSLVLVLSIIGTASLFYGLFVIQAAFSFWTIETLELMNTTTYGGLQAGQYPMSIYGKQLRFIFTFAVPLSCVAYYPIATLLDHESTFLGLPLIGIVFLGVACKLWKFGIRHYSSTGS